ASGVDDAAGALRQHAPAFGAARVEHAVEVHRHDAAPVLVAQVLARVVVHDARVVDRDVERTGGGDDVLDGGVDAGRIGHVGRDELRAQVLGGGLTDLGVAVTHEHAGQIG